MGRGQVLHFPYREDPMHSKSLDRGGLLLVYTWLGRRKAMGRGARSSGLVFDQIVPKVNRTG